MLCPRNFIIFSFLRCSSLCVLPVVALEALVCNAVYHTRSFHALGWKGPLRSSTSNPFPWTGMPLTGLGHSQLHPTCICPWWTTPVPKATFKWGWIKNQNKQKKTPTTCPAPPQKRKNRKNTSKIIQHPNKQIQLLAS